VAGAGITAQAGVTERLQWNALAFEETVPRRTYWNSAPSLG
jgi:hypothetical protein